MRCTQIVEPSDMHGWNDNYLCVSEKTPYHFSWTFSGLRNCAAGMKCVQWNEMGDPHTWGDNYLCDIGTGIVPWSAGTCSDANRRYGSKKLILVLGAVLVYVLSRVI